MSTLYAWRTALCPTSERAALGAPSTGWIHEGQPPWRVIVADSPDGLGQIVGCSVVEYTGDEDTVTLDELRAAAKKVSAP
jgi:hypothetical protein